MKSFKNMVFSKYWIVGVIGACGYYGYKYLKNKNIYFKTE